MSPDEITYLFVLLISIPVGFLFKNASSHAKQWGGATLGLLIILVTCHIHILHSVITIFGTWLIVKKAPRSCHFLVLGWTFSYLLLFRTVTLYNFPSPTSFSNAVQLLLTLKLVSFANEVQEFSRAKKQEVVSISSQSSAGLITRVPSLTELFLYCYCYIGLMTGPFYRYKTYFDWLQQMNSEDIPSWKPMIVRMKPAPVFGVLFLIVSYYFPLNYVKMDDFYQRAFLFRLFYMVPIFFVFRMRFYVAWIFAECSCIAAAFGAYPVTLKSRSGGGPTVEYAPLERSTAGVKHDIEYDYETIKNIDCYGADFCVKVKDGMRCWNMSVQWWLAQYIYKNSPIKSFVFGSTWTMLISAYWHGIHPGYYLSFLTIPLCLTSEGMMDTALRRHLGHSGKLVFDWIHWFLKMRAYDYMCMGFVLLTFSDTVRYWKSIYFAIHVLAIFFIILGRVLTLRAHWVLRHDKREGRG